MSDLQLLITGGPGSGASTTGEALANILEIPWYDSDNFFHKPTDPPYQEQYSKKERYDLVHENLRCDQSWILSGSICAWDISDIKFSHAVILNISTPTRIKRLIERERQRFGNRINLGGDMYQEYTSFIQWASCYETGELGGRSLPLERSFLKTNCSNTLEITHESTVSSHIQAIISFIRN